MSKVLVTGAAGFIGSHICEALLAKGHVVIGVDDMSGGTMNNVPKHMWCWENSITNVEFIDRLFMKEAFDYVIHAAAYAAEGLSHFIRRFNYENNLIGSINLINASVRCGVKGFVFLSSIAVYGAQKPPFTEEMAFEPMDPYGIAKAAVEEDLKLANQTFHLPYVIFRPHNVYGERQNMADRYRNVIGIFMNQAMQGKAMTIFGHGYQQRAFSHISNVAPTIAESIDREDCWGQTFNVGGDEVTNVNDLSKMVSMAMGVDHRVLFLPARHEAVYAHCDHTKLRQFFGVSTRTMPLGLGLAMMAQWAQQVGPQTPSRFGNIELTLNLPPSWQP